MDLIPFDPKLNVVKRNKFRSLKLISNVDMEQPLGREPLGVEHGRLDNGLTYYVRSNSNPKMRAALSLCVKAGSILEEEHGRGVAHIIEHLAFSATTNQDTVNFLESIEAKFATEIYADWTVYYLFVPVDNPDVLSQAISILAEFSTEIRVTAKDLENEREALMEYYRDIHDASGRIEEAKWTLTLEGSKYAQRWPFGTENAIQTVSAETVRQFYSKWYNLKNMAVVVVGDFPDTQSVVELTKTHFGKRSLPLDPPLLPQFEVPSHEEPRISFICEPETSESAVMIRCSMPAVGLNTVKAYRDLIVETLFIRALNQRLLKLSSRKDPPFFECSAACGGIVCPIKHYTMTSSCKENRTLEALESMLIELARIRLHGFSEKEISIVRALLMSEFESIYLGRDQYHSCHFRYEYLQHFLTKSPGVGIEFQAQLQKTLLPSISSPEVAEYAEKFRTSFNCVISAIEPHDTLTTDDLKNVVSKINSLEDERNIAAWDEEHITEEIVHTKPDPGSIIQQFENPHIGVTGLILSNGMKICYKCTDFLDDQVVFIGFSHGGLSELSKSECFSSLMGSAIAGETGVFGYKPSVLRDMLAGKRAEVRTDLFTYTRTFSGDCSPTELETALQLVYQLFTTNVAPTEEEVSVVKQMVEEGIRTQESDPYTAFANRVKELNYGQSHFFRAARINDYPKVDPIKVCEYFNDSFKDPSTFTVAIVGNIDPAVACPLILRYLGGIPKPSNPVLQFSRDDLKVIPFKFPERITREVVYSPMVEAQCSVTLSFPIELKKGATIEEYHFVGILSNLLETKIIQVLRFKHEQINSASVSVCLAGNSVSFCQQSGNRLSFSCGVRGVISINFSCDPSISSTLVEVALDEIVRLQEEGPTDQDVSTILETEQRVHENELEDNYYLLERIYLSYRFTGDLAASFDQGLEDARVKVRQSLTPETVRSALQRLLPYPCTTKYTVAILMPGTSRYQLLKSVCSGNAKALVGIAGLITIGVSLWRHLRRTQTN